MDSITMLRTAVALFAIAAVGGLVMTGIRFLRHVNPPAWLAMLHGLLAAAGLALVGFAAFTAGVPSIVVIGFVLLLVAAAGGALLNLRYQWKQRLLPGSIVAIHATAAVVGFGCLVVAAFSS